MVVVARATRPPEGLHQNQAKMASPMVWGWHLRAGLGHWHAPGDGMGQSRWPQWCGQSLVRSCNRGHNSDQESIVEIWYISMYINQKQNGRCKTRPKAGAYNFLIRFLLLLFFSRRFVVCRFCTSRWFFGYSAMKNQFYFLYPKINSLQWIYF